MSRGKWFESARRLYFSGDLQENAEEKSVVILDPLPLDTTRARSPLVNSEAVAR